MQQYLEQLKALESDGLLRRCRIVEPEPKANQAMRVRVDGKPAVNFSSNDYLGLSKDPRLQEAAIEAIHCYGTGNAASRLISGTTELAHELEETVAAFKQAEAALVFNSGYQANVAILQALAGPGDWLFCDRLNHASLVDGCLLSGARWTRYRHLDLNHLEQKLKKVPTNVRKWIITDSVFSMDGDYPDLNALADLAERYGAFVMVDEAHASGLYGDTRSSGLCEQFGVSNRIALQMGTFSKALGGAGAYVAGPKTLIQNLINRARGFIYSTAMPPATMAASKRAIEVVMHDPMPKQRLWENVRLFERCLREKGLAVGPLKSPIIPIVLGDNARTLQASQTLLERGFFVQAIRQPTVPAGTERLRIALSAAHEPHDIIRLAEALVVLIL
ncbi:MAG TPA: 8-amino-7-oxononanoate synthase [Oculatellaceae cyanobacterium]|jgi:8-amino-7-oxononanoate synthase